MTAYFQTVATVIPVLFIAGLMNPTILREYSKTSSRSQMLNKEIKHACIAMGLAVVMVPISNAYDTDDGLVGYWRTAIVITMWTASGYCAGVTGVLIFYIRKIVRLATEDHPHPDRLESDAKDLENRLALIRSQQRELGVDHSADGGSRYYDGK